MPFLKFQDLAKTLRPVVLERIADALPIAQAPGCIEELLETCERIGFRILVPMDLVALPSGATKCGPSCRCNTPAQHDPDNPACAWNDPETFANPATAGLPCNCEPSQATGT